MTKKVIPNKKNYASLDPSILELTPEPHSKFSFRAKSGSKYDVFFDSVGENMRIKLPIGFTDRIAPALKKYHEKRGRQVIVSAVSDCGDGFGGVWWFDKPRTTSNFPKVGSKK